MKRTVLRWALGLAWLAAIGATLTQRGRFDGAALQAWVDAAGAAGPLLFVAVYAVATVLFLPGAVVTLAGGALFGPLWGTLWNLTGATVGAALAFLIARYLGADWVARRAGPRLQALSDGVATEGWRFIAFVRLVPLFPFNLLNYALGLTRVSFLIYLLASWVFMLPGAFAYIWLGHAGREALSGGDGLIRTLTIALSLLAAVALLPALVRRFRAQPMLAPLELKRQLDAGEDVLPLEGLPARMAELEGCKQRPIRLICRTDGRSAQAARLLADASFTDARVVRGGMTAWRAKGWPVTGA